MQEKELLLTPTAVAEKNLVIDWIDRELVNTYTLDFERDMRTNTLLDLRHLFLHFGTDNVHRTLSSFYHLLPKLEEHYYLIGYRIRHWISLNFSLEGSDPLMQEEPIVRNICQTMRSLEIQRKIFFELFDYRIPFHDVRVRFKPISK